MTVVYAVFPFAVVAVARAVVKNAVTVSASVEIFALMAASVLVEHCSPAVRLAGFVDFALVLIAVAVVDDFFCIRSRGEYLLLNDLVVLVDALVGASVGLFQHSVAVELTFLPLAFENIAVFIVIQACSVIFVAEPVALVFHSAVFVVFYSVTALPAFLIVAVILYFSGIAELPALAVEFVIREISGINKRSTGIFVI